MRSEAILVTMLILVIFQLGLPKVDATIYFDDGGTHIIDYKVSETISVDWASPGKETQLYVVDGAEVIDTYTGVAVIAYEDSILNISGGYMSSRVVCVGRSTAYFYDGIIYNGLYASSESEVYMSGGVIGSYLGAYGYGTVYLSGGAIGNTLATFDNGRIFVTGGNLELTLRASQNSIITIYGTDFNYEYGEIGVTSGKLTGTLANGDPINNYFYINDNASIILVPKPALAVNIDIKPGSCPNPVNVKSKGVLPVAVLGTEDVNVIDIVIASIRLADPNVAPIRNSYEDVAAPVFDANDCNCTTDGPDGFLDLTLKFETRRIVEAIGDVNHGDILTLMLTGVLFDETPIEGTDCVLIRGRHKPFNVADINKDGVVDTVDFAIFSENWLQSSIVDD